MTVIGVDFGDKRIGIAKSSGVLASGVCTITVTGIKDAVSKTASKIAELGGTLVVLGLPRNMDGTEGFRAERTRTFADLLTQQSGVEVVFIDERLTTSEAYTYMNITGFASKKRRGVIDTLSAQLILQSWLDLQKNQ